MLSELPQTLRTPKFAAPTAPRDGCLVHIYPSGPLLGTRYPLTEDTVLIGRTDACRVQNTDTSVSRTHARIDRTPRGLLVTDLGSTNGTFVNDARCREAVLADGDYLRIGNCIYRYLAGGNVESQYHEEIYRLTVVDALTGLGNRRHLFDFLARELARSARHGRPLSLAVLDIDHFKRVNDQYGHAAGDAVLRDVAAMLRARTRADELSARFGGEEFALVLPEADAADALAACERLRESVAGCCFRCGDYAIPVTVSVGVMTMTGEAAVAADALFQMADAKLYEAKSAGRNRVVAGVV
ncbi:MAG TPA: GGDEF domain-containing protein [Gemmataceae bacterium]|nr:GGDEF domain-containing protein [Gemmataceae bacterium]